MYVNQFDLLFVQLGARGAIGAPARKPPGGGAPSAAGTPSAAAAGAGGDQKKPPSGAQAPSSAREAHRKQQEQEYLQRLKQIRLQNFNERRNIKENQNPAPVDAKYKVTTSIKLYKCHKTEQYQPVI